MVDTPVVLEVRGLTKRFPGVLANDHISLSLHKGQVLGLLGENGAGKSTLMNLIYGLYSPDEGEILVNDAPVTIRNANDAIALGIGMVHQHFQLVPVLTVTENIMLGNEAVNGPFLNRRAARKRILEISDQYGLEVNPDALVQDLPVGVQQRVEIIKALYRQADILILDEPTAVLTPQETEGLFGIMRTLLERGVSIIFISHKLKEVLEICDWITVLRGGRVVGHADPQTATQESLAAMMVGREVLLQVEKGRASPGEPVLVIHDLNVEDDRRLRAVRNLTLEVRAGEILGIAGVQGNGQTELVEAITRLRHVVSGHISINGRDVSHATPRMVTETGVGHVPEDRQKNGMVAAFPVKDNLALQQYYLPPFSTPLVDMKRTEPGIPTKFAVADIVTLLCSVALAIGFLLMPWLNVLGIGTTGIRLLFSQTDTSILWLILIELIISASMVVQASLNPSGRRMAGIGAFLAGIIGLIYYIFVFIQNIQSPIDVSGLVGIGYWVVLLATIGLIMQVFIPRVAITSTNHVSSHPASILLNETTIEEHARRLVKEYDVRTPDIFTTISKLSGGNQQKAIVAREFSRDVRLLIAAQPTRGLDVGSIEFIHRQIVKMRDAGTAVLLVSAELDEILSLSDRVAVMYAGEIIDILPIERADRERVGLLMAGVRAKAAVND